jgi:hypothetical protein
MLGDPFHLLSALRPINPDQTQLFAGTSAVGEEAPGSCGGRDRGGSDNHGHE